MRLETIKENPSKKKWIILGLNNYLLLLLLLCIIFFSCSKSKKEEEIEIILINVDTLKKEPDILATNLTYKKVDSLKRLVYESGNNDAYQILSNYYLNSGDEKEFLRISKFLSNRYNNSNAQYKVYVEMLYYYQIADCEKKTLSCLPFDKRNIALSYLKMAVKNKNIDAIIEYKKLKHQKIIR